jgi:UDP:flavonoid glycosyltransferase YjiC (YdhE family)
MGDAVMSVLSDSRYRLRARALRDDFARTNALDAIASAVEELAGAHE